MDCIFCKIINGQISAKKVFENDSVLVFENIKPVHPVHVLIIPKKHIDNIQSAVGEDKDWLAEMLLVVPEIAKKQGVDKSGYRLIINFGEDSGQVLIICISIWLAARNCLLPPANKLNNNDRRQSSNKFSEFFWDLVLENWNLNTYVFRDQKEATRERAGDDAPFPKSGTAKWVS